MEEWGFVDERELQGWKGGCVCITCQHFTYGVDQHCHTLLGCNLRQQQLQRGEHLKKKCKLWAPTWQKEMGWPPKRSSPNGETTGEEVLRELAQLRLPASRASCPSGCLPSSR